MTRRSRSIRELYAAGFRITDAGEVTTPEGETRSTYTDKRKDGLKYHRFTVSGEHRQRYPIMVHKFAAYCRFGEPALAAGVHVRHLDGNPENNTVANLALGTAQQNMLDKPPEVRTRVALIAASARRRLTPERARELVALRTGGATQKSLAVRFNLRASTVSEILSGKLYSTLTGITRRAS